MLNKPICKGAKAERRQKHKIQQPSEVILSEENQMDIGIDKEPHNTRIFLNCLSQV